MCQPTLTKYCSTCYCSNWSKENCSSPSTTDRNVPKELTSALSIDGYEKAWMHGEGEESKPKI